MKRRGTSRNQGRINEGGGEEVTSDLVALGDVIGIRLHGGSWWPAQVVDENTVNEGIKPGKRSAGKVLVRLYGSYKYLYVDPTKCRSEFEMILKENNGSYKKIFQQALEQDLPSSKPCRSKDPGSKTKAKETSMGNGMPRNVKANSSKAQGKARRASDQNGISSSKKRNITNIEKKGSKSSAQDDTTENFNQLIPSHKKEDKSKSYKQKEVQKEVLNEDDLSSQSPEPISSGKSQELSARRIKVMNRLGLIAPPGSPFHKN